jgi:hypothetical protein
VLDDIPHPLDLILAGKLVLLVEAGRHPGVVPSVVAIEKSTPNSSAWFSHWDPRLGSRG